MNDTSREIGVKAGCVVEIWKHGVYINTVENTQDAVKIWLIKNMPPTPGTPTDKTGVVISEYIGFQTLIYHATKVGFTFKIVKRKH